MLVFVMTRFGVAKGKEMRNKFSASIQSKYVCKQGSLLSKACSSHLYSCSTIVYILCEQSYIYFKDIFYFDSGQK